MTEGLYQETTMTATYQVLVDDMKALGIAQVFGLMSDDTAVFATALDSSGIRFYGARHENNAIAMAEGYSPPRRTDCTPPPMPAARARAC
jgi:glyoxylate carboligase